ncbi:glycoside hydrolase domain-containing protein [Streptomyces sp. M10(2022)]
MIGTANGGNTFPGATLPYGMIAWSPTSTRGDQTSTGAANGYEYGATRMRGLSLTHVNGAGCNPGAAGDVPIMPFVGDITSSPSADSKDAVYAADFSHDNERAVPGRYSVGLDSGATADLAVSKRAGVADFGFPAGKPANLLFRVSNSLNGSEDAEVKIDTAHRKVTGSVLTGAFCGRRANGGTNNRKSYYRLYFSASFDRDFASTGTWKDGTLAPGATTGSGGEGTPPARTGRAGVRRLGGLRHCGRRRRPDADRDLLRQPGRRRGQPPRGGAAGHERGRCGPRRVPAWDRELNSARVGGGSTAQRTTFYTALYHSLMQPNLISDTDGRYPGMDGAPHRVKRGRERSTATSPAGTSTVPRSSYWRCSNPRSPVISPSPCTTSRARTTGCGTAGCTSTGPPT